MEDVVKTVHANSWKSHGPSNKHAPLALKSADSRVTVESRGRWPGQRRPKLPRRAPTDLIDVMCLLTSNMTIAQRTESL